nr:hypothetical protein [Moritella viscosa]SHO03583.1 Chromosomal replication initiator protein DnaA [Moritella viscosa]
MHTDNTKDYIYNVMPDINEHLEQLSVPIYDRYLQASHIFVDAFVLDSTFSSKKNIVKSNEFHEYIIPIFHDWYHENYGTLAKNPKNFNFKGLIIVHKQPVIITFPSTISIPEEEGKTSWMKYPDHLDNSENIQNMFVERVIDLNILSGSQRTKVQNQIEDVVSKIRSIAINFKGLSLDDKTERMARTVITDFEKAAVDIASHYTEQGLTACWHIQQAIEKTFKVFLKQQQDYFEETHILRNLYNSAIDVNRVGFDGIDSKLIDSCLKNTIDLRYAQELLPLSQSIDFYKKALKIVLAVSEKFERDIQFKNASFLLKKAPWAK